MQLKNSIKLLAFLFLLSCGEQKQEGDLGNYFDLQGFFESQIAYLEQGNYGLEKSLSNSDGNENVVLQSPDWSAELQLFLNYDLAHPGQQGNFLVDTVESPIGRSINYTGVNPDVALKKVSILFQGAELMAIEMVDSVSTSMYNSSRKLFYMAAVPSYGIEVNQDSRLFENSVYRIEGKAVQQ